MNNDEVSTFMSVNLLTISLETCEFTIDVDIMMPK